MVEDLRNRTTHLRIGNDESIPDNTAHSVLFRNIVCPVIRCDFAIVRDKIIQDIKTYGKGKIVMIIMAWFTDTEIMKALNECKGVLVLVNNDSTNFNATQLYLSYLRPIPRDILMEVDDPLIQSLARKADFAPVRVISCDGGIMHIKKIIYFDHTLTPCAIWTGSYNLSKSAATRNCESGLLLENPNVAKMELRNFAALLNKSEPFANVDWMKGLAPDHPSSYYTYNSQNNSYTQSGGQIHDPQTPTTKLKGDSVKKFIENRPQPQRHRPLGNHGIYEDTRYHSRVDHWNPESEANNRLDNRLTRFSRFNGNNRGYEDRRDIPLNRTRPPMRARGRGRGYMRGRFDPTLGYRGRSPTYTDRDGSGKDKRHQGHRSDRESRDGSSRKSSNTSDIGYKESSNNEKVSTPSVKSQVQLVKRTLTFSERQSAPVSSNQTNEEENADDGRTVRFDATNLYNNEEDDNNNGDTNNNDAGDMEDDEESDDFSSPIENENGSNFDIIGRSELDQIIQRATEEKNNSHRDNIDHEGRNEDSSHEEGESRIQLASIGNDETQSVAQNYQQHKNVRESSESSGINSTISRADTQTEKRDDNNIYAYPLEVISNILKKVNMTENNKTSSTVASNQEPLTEKPLNKSKEGDVNISVTIENVSSPKLTMASSATTMASSSEVILSSSLSSSSNPKSTTQNPKKRKRNERESFESISTGITKTIANENESVPATKAISEGVAEKPAQLGPPRKRLRRGLPPSTDDSQIMVESTSNTTENNSQTNITKTLDNNTGEQPNEQVTHKPKARMMRADQLVPNPKKKAATKIIAKPSSIPPEEKTLVTNTKRAPIPKKGVTAPIATTTVIGSQTTNGNTVTKKKNTLVPKPGIVKKKATVSNTTPIAKKVVTPPASTLSTTKGVAKKGSVAITKKKSIPKITNDQMSKKKKPTIVSKKKANQTKQVATPRPKPSSNKQINDQSKVIATKKKNNLDEDEDIIVEEVHKREKEDNYPSPESGDESSESTSLSDSK